MQQHYEKSGRRGADLCHSPAIRSLDLRKISGTPQPTQQEISRTYPRLLQLASGRRSGHHDRDSQDFGLYFTRSQL